MDTTHKHVWLRKDNELICECGKTKLFLDFSNEEVAIGIKSDGREYSVRSNRDRILNPDEWFNLLSNLKEHQVFTFKVLLLTGARINEAQHIKVEDIDFPNQRLVLKVTKRRHGDNIQNKSKTRTIRVSRELIKDLRKVINDNNLNRENELGLLSQPAAHKALKKALEKAKVKDYKMLSIHSIRKTSENWALSIGVDSMKLSTRFGHNLITQYEHYSQSDSFTPKEKEQIRQIYGDTFI